jgi:Flp pilus assembly pilin Flp
MQKLYSLLVQDEAQTMAEYSIVLTVITLAALTAFVLLGAASTGALTRVAGYFS